MIFFRIDNTAVTKGCDKTLAGYQRLSYPLFVSFAGSPVAGVNAGADCYSCGNGTFRIDLKRLVGELYRLAVTPRRREITGADGQGDSVLGIDRRDFGNIARAVFLLDSPYCGAALAP